MRFFSWMALAVVLAVGCGPSEYERANAKLMSAKMRLESAEEGLRIYRRDPDLFSSKEDKEIVQLWIHDVEQSKKAIEEATATLERLGH